jgi:D-alanine-D-alanine ligase-like ATP-grasp enzyme
VDSGSLLLEYEGRGLRSPEWTQAATYILTESAAPGDKGSLIDKAVLDLLPRWGRPGLEVAVRLDLLRALGMRNVWRRMRDEARLDAIPSAGQRLGYEGMWRDAADELGARVANLSDGFLEISKGAARARVWNHVVPLDDDVTLKLSLDKTLVHRLLAEAGLPVPTHTEFDAVNPHPAHALLARSAGPCVVKPVTSDAGSGTTTGVRTTVHLRRAILRARRVDSRLLIERQAPGYAHRMLMLDGELLDVVKRYPPQVTGDGRSTIAELIAGENQRRMERAGGRGQSQLLRIDLDCLFTLEAAGLSPNSVLPAGERIPVKTAVSQNAPQENEGVLRHSNISPALVEEARIAVDALGLRLAAVEVVTPDTSGALRDVGGIVLEVNAPPGLRYHYDIAEPEYAVRVAVPILRRVLEG